MGINIEQAEDGHIGLIALENNRIIQIGVPAEENAVIQVFFSYIIK